MPRIYDPRNPVLVQQKYVPDDTFSAIGQIGGQILKSAESDRFLIDASQFEMDKISAMEQLEQNSRYDAATGQTFIGDQPIEGNITEHAIKLFNERVAPLEKKYGTRGKEWAAAKRIEAFGRATNLNSRITQVGNIDHYENFVQFSAKGIEDGVSSFGEIMSMNDAMLDSMAMSPEARQRSKDFSNNYLTEAQFNNDLKTNPVLAIDRVNNKYYTTATPEMQDRFAGEVDSFIKGEAMKEAQKALEAASLGMRHVPNASVVAYANQRGLYDVAAMTQAAQGRAAMIDSVTSGNLLNGKAKVDRLMSDAVSTQDPAKYALAAESQKALTNKTNMVVGSPQTALLWEGIRTNPDDYSDFNALVENRRDIAIKAQKQFGIEPNFLGESAPVISEMIKQAPAGQRSSIVAQLAAPMNDYEKSRATIEMMDINPRIGVAMTLPPQKAELGNQILSDVDMAYMPKDTKFSPVVMKIDSGVEWGDVNAKNAVIEAAKNAYAYKAKMNNWSPEGVEEDEFQKIVNDIAGEPISFGAGKTTNFYTDMGEFADPDKAKSSLDYAIESGSIPDVYDSRGAPLNTKKLVDNGRLVPTGENGKYYVVRYGMDGKEHYRNADGTYYIVDLKDITNKFGGSQKSQTNSVYNKIMSGNLF